MTTLAIISLLFGATLGSRFTVSILFPAAPLVWGVAIVTVVVKGDGLWSAVLGGFLVLSTLEIGYLVGTAIRRFTAPQQALRPSVVVEPNTISHSTF